MKTMHLFAGAGGGLLADLILGHDPICAVEWDRYACAVLRERAAEGWFPNLSVYEGDIRMFDASEYKGRVDCIHAGFPCQDISTAGKRAGVGEGTRSNLYVEALRIFREVGPEYLFLENVSAILGGGMLETVMSDLAQIGFDEVKWKCLRASEVGANHHRNRWWCLAHSKRTGRPRHWDEGRWEDTGGAPDIFKESGGDIPHSTGNGWIERGTECEGLQRCATSEQSQGIIPDSNKVGFSTEAAKRELARERFDSDYNEPRGSGWQPTTAEWWQTEPDLGRVVDGMASRVDRLKAIGNGQVPLQAAAAWVMLGGPHNFSPRYTRPMNTE